MSILDFPTGLTESQSQPSAESFLDDPQWPAYRWPAEPIRAVAATKIELFELRLLILAGTAAIVGLICWLLSPERFGDPLVYLGLTFAVLLRTTVRLFEWYNYWSVSLPPLIPPKRNLKVDVFTTACPGEPTGMIIRTLKAMVAIEYPHTNYLCDEGNDPRLRQICDELGVIHVTRNNRAHAKAGNINNALQQARGDIAVVLDPDHEPSPYLLERTLGQFEDPRVGFVQCVQAYRNQDDSFVARGAAEQSYNFYGPHMMGMHGRGTTQAIGANCIFRRSALDDIGGHAPGLAEDMHTSMRMYSRGWKSVYVPEILTRGLVPSTLASFYRQQIKWSCGVFDLLFQEYPLLCRGFTLSQKIHFLICPIFFLRGLVGMLEMLIPLSCLVFGFVAWRATLPQLVLWFLPVQCLSSLIHIRVQRWLLEPHERGFHLAGGLLTLATWWVYLAGFLCALFRIRVPYIPTPKEGEPVNAIGIAIPNVLVAAVLTAGSAMGLYLDSSPTTFFMAGIAMLNAFALIYVSIAAQQLMVRQVTQRVLALRTIISPMKLTARGVRFLYNVVLKQIREGLILPAACVIALVAACYSLMPRASVQPVDHILPGEGRNVGGFYTGIEIPGADGSDAAARYAELQKQLNFNFRLVAFQQPWHTAAEFPAAALQQLRKTGATPFINWLPVDDAIDSSSGQPVSDKPILKAIRDGHYDNYIDQFAEKIREFAEPVFVCFAPQQDDPNSPWAVRPDGLNSSIDFAEAWKHIAVLFREQGAANVAWVWSPFKADAIDSDNPLQLEYINWIAVPAASGETSFSQQYESFRPRIARWNLPVMVNTLNVTNSHKQWVQAAMSSIAGQYPEIKGVVIKSEPPSPVAAAPGNTNRDTGLQPVPVAYEITSNANLSNDAECSVDHNQAALVHFESEMRTARTALIREILCTQPCLGGAVQPSDTAGPMWFDLHPSTHRSSCVQGTPGHFELKVDGAPFYVKGIVYNPGHDWRDAELPLTRRQLDDDFSRIHEMGGNTIRRYGTNFSDRNIFNAAADNHLKVMYGFWLPQDVNYMTADENLARCESVVESTVRRYRNHPGLLGWCLGNEVWGLLKHKFAQPYLTEVRHAEVLYVEKLAKRIKELDPNHPVFCAQESFDVSGAVSDYAAGAPSVDVMCVNSYYEQEIAHLDQAVTHIDPDRPYLISEFGPDGYWDDKYNHRDEQKGLLEATGMLKGWLYADRWREYVYHNRGRDVGGVAYCWTDRYEGTATWFGMNDLDGRAKPACAALSEAWNDPSPDKYGTFVYNGPKITDVSYPTKPIQPRTPFKVHVAFETVNGDRSACAFTVTGPDFSVDSANIHPDDSGDSATIELPDKPGWYRVQIKVTDREGLDEASVPVKVAPGEVAAPATR